MLPITILMVLSAAVKELSCLPTPGLDDHSLSEAKSSVTRQVNSDYIPDLRVSKIKFKIPASALHELNLIEQSMMSGNIDLTKRQKKFKKYKKVEQLNEVISNDDSGSDDTFESCECTRTGPELEQTLMLAGYGNPTGPSVPYQLSFNKNEQARLPHSGHFSLTEYDRVPLSPAAVAYLENKGLQVLQPQQINAEVLDNVDLLSRLDYA